MDRGERATKQKGRTYCIHKHSNIRKQKSQKHSAKNKPKQKNYDKACITIPTEDNTEEEERLLKEKNIGEEDLKN